MPRMRAARTAVPVATGGQLVNVSEAVSGGRNDCGVVCGGGALLGGPVDVGDLHLGAVVPWQPRLVACNTCPIVGRLAVVAVRHICCVLEVDLLGICYR